MRKASSNVYRDDAQEIRMVQIEEKGGESKLKYLGGFVTLCMFLYLNRDDIPTTMFILPVKYFN